MTAFDNIRPEPGTPVSRWRKPLRWLRRKLPRGLYGRTLLIIVLPMLILQAVVAFVFMERHWRLVTGRLSTAVTRDIAAVIDLLDVYPANEDYRKIAQIVQQRMEMSISIQQGDALPVPLPPPFFSILDSILGDEIKANIARPYWINTFGISRVVEIRILLENDRILTVRLPRGRTYATNSHIFLVWMVSIALALIIVSILFLRGQLRPILNLAKAAESFGKGQKTPTNFSISGADEVRKAGLAFMLMRERIERQIEQRTAMLAGVSHDLRTILTRFKLQLALLGDSPENDEMKKDVEDMQAMLEGYLAFARGETEDEDVAEISLTDCFARFQTQADAQEKQLNFELNGSDEISVRPNAFNRLISNLVTNAFHHADRLDIYASNGAKWLTITLDDNGPGISKELREDVFKPFFRVDSARNLNETGTGLGLSIARDIARNHGGNIRLEDSPLGGLRAIVQLPV